MGAVLTTVGWEADQLATALGAPVVPMLCVHDVQLPWGELYVDGIPVLTVGRLVATLRALPPGRGHAAGRAGRDAMQA